MERSGQSLTMYVPFLSVSPTYTNVHNLTLVSTCSKPSRCTPLSLSTTTLPRQTRCDHNSGVDALARLGWRGGGDEDQSDAGSCGEGGGGGM